MAGEQGKDWAGVCLTLFSQPDQLGTKLLHECFHILFNRLAYLKMSRCMSRLPTASLFQYGAKNGFHERSAQTGS